MDSARCTELSIHTDTYIRNAAPINDTAYRYPYCGTRHVVPPVQGKNSAHVLEITQKEILILACRYMKLRACTIEL
jgi:hypothetical protein